MKRWFRRPSNIIPHCRRVPRAVSLFLPQHAPRCSSRDIPRSWPAILALTKPSHCCGSVSGGRPWLLTPVSSSPACPVCAHNKSSHRAPATLLHPKPLPHCPWSHTAVAFVTNTVIFTVVDLFSKSIHLIPLAILP